MRKNQKTTRKGQLQIGESIAVLLVFFMFLVFGLIFFAKFQQSDIVERSEKVSETLAVAISQKISTMPELRCSEEKSLEVNCFDLQNIIIFSEVLPGFMEENKAHTKEYFWDSYQYSSIQLILLNHFDKTYAEPYILYSDVPNFTRFDQKVTLMPIIVRNVSVTNPRGEYYFGILNITTYSLKVVS